MKKLLLTYLVCGFATFLRAQQAAPTPRPEPPPGPLLATAADFSQWTILSKTWTTPIVPPPDASPTPAEAAPSTAGNPKPTPDLTEVHITVVKTKPLRMEQTVSFGAKTVQWFTPGLRVTESNASMPVVAFGGAGADFPGFEWISRANFEGVKKVAGRDCLVFRDAYKLGGKVVKSDQPLTTLACIELESRLPVVLQSGSELRTYQFGATPPAMLTLPPNVDSLVTQWRQSAQRAALPAAKP